MSKETHVSNGKVWMSKEDFVKEHNRLLTELKSGPEYEDQKKELEEVKGGNMKNEKAEEKGEKESLSKIIADLQAYIDAEHKEGTEEPGEDEEVNKLQQALDLVKEVLHAEGKEGPENDMGEDHQSMTKNKVVKQPNAATMPMDQLRNKISAIPGMPQNPKVPPNLNSY